MPQYSSAIDSLNNREESCTQGNGLFTREVQKTLRNLQDGQWTRQSLHHSYQKLKSHKWWSFLNFNLNNKDYDINYSC